VSSSLGTAHVARPDYSVRVQETEDAASASHDVPRAGDGARDPGTPTSGAGPAAPHVPLGPDVPDETEPPRGAPTARAELRDAEAQRVLGLLAVGELPARARQWLVDGLEHEGITALADSGSETEPVRSRLLRETAEALGLAFATPRAAREHHAQVVIRSMTATSAASAALVFSNGVTDAFEESARQRVTRLFRPRG